MRGKGGVTHRPLEFARITPAYAGKRGRGLQRFRSGRDHPRACGEKPRPLCIPKTLLGSPPRMRGKDRGNACYYPAHRITPAHAGKRIQMSAALPSQWDHPRACGEKMRFTSPRKCVIGSPPRMRGKVLYVLVSGEPNEDHPRACGEKRPVSRYDFGHGGSPPRMRGKGVICTIPRGIFGITPAHAGKSLLQGSLCRLFAGSPPRMRGKDAVHVAAQVRDRITPAHAGKSIFSRTPKKSRPNHPRACGEK